MSVEIVRHLMVPVFCNAEVRRTSGQLLLTSTIQARHLSLFGHMDDTADANDLECHNFTLTQALNTAQNHSLCCTLSGRGRNDVVLTSEPLDRDM